MKTNQILTVSFIKGEIAIGHKDHMGSLDMLFHVGNQYRVEAGNPLARQKSWLGSNAVKEFIEVVAKDIGRPAMRTKKGVNGGTWVHLRVLIDAAMYLDANFKNEVIKTFVDSRILQMRDDSGDNFIELNAAIALKAEEVLGKPSHKGHYIQIAKIIKERLGIEDWNLAPSEALSERTRIERTMCSMLDCGVIDSWAKLKEVCQKC